MKYKFILKNISIVLRGHIDGHLTADDVKVKQMFGTPGRVYYGIPNNMEPSPDVAEKIEAALRDNPIWILTILQNKLKICILIPCNYDH